MGAGGLAGLSVAQAYGQSVAIEARGEYQNTMSQINARNAERMGRDAVARGNKAAGVQRSKVNQLIGAQKSAYAASGVEVGYGTAAKVQEQTRDIGYDDAITIENNAFLESLGYQQAAFNSSQAGEMERSAASFKAGSTLLGGGLKAADKLYENYGGSGLKKAAAPAPSGGQAGGSYSDFSNIS